MPTTVQRKKSKFARNRFREEETGSFFNKTSSGLTSAFALIVTIFFTPALITSSLLSKEILIPFANIFLSLGYLSNFFYRIYQGEMSKAELIVSLLALTGLIVGAFILFPPAAASLTALSVIQFVNQFAVVVNIFFMVRHIVVPPTKHLIEKVANYFGFDISGQYFSKPKLTLEHDRFVVDRILEKDSGHDSHSPHYQAEELDRLNKLLTKLTMYVCKYDEAVFGYIRNKDKIAAFEKRITELTVIGDADSSYNLIKNKIRFKTTKLQLLQRAVDKIQQALSDPQQEDDALAYFYKPLFHKQEENKELLAAGLKDLQTEVARQQTKINSLKECLPIAKL